MKLRLALLLCLAFSACASQPAGTDAASPAAPAVPEMLPPAPKLTVEAVEEGENFVLISRRGTEELDRLKVRKVRGMFFDGGNECGFDSPANEVDYVIASFAFAPEAQRQDQYDPELYSVYGASRADGKIKKFPKKSASCYFVLP